MSNIKKFKPLIFLLVVTVITLNLWVTSKSSLSTILATPLTSLSQILALLGIVLMSCSILISTRITFIEKLLKGMDKAYGVHQIAGSLAFIFILSHPLLLVIQALPRIQVATMYLFPSVNLSYTLGIFALYSMVLSFVFMAFIKLPYNIWKLTHKLLGVTFLLGSVHALMVGSDIAAFLPLKVWLSSWIGIGIFSTMYSLFFYRKFGPKFSYQIERIERTVDIVTIFLRPQSEKVISFEPGQFVYVEFKNKKIGRELHPFSIASGINDERIQLSAKIVGDYTLKLAQNLREGNGSLLYGPYGQFAGNASSLKNCIWIAGGIGITPFLSMLSSEIARPTDKSIHFYYTYSTKEEGSFLNQVQVLSENAPHVKFFDWCTQEKKRLSADVIKNHLDLAGIDAIFLCGSLSMMEGLKKQFMSIGVSEQKIIYENFAYIT